MRPRNGGGLRGAIERKRHPLCERCAAEGYTKGAAVAHHKTPLDAAGGAKLKLAESNLEALCREFLP